MDFLILPLARGLRFLTPNQLTVFGLLLAIAAAIVLWQSAPEDELSNYYLVIAGFLVFFHGLLDMVDGVVARTFYKATPLGDFLDHVADRVADILLLGAIAFSPWGDVRVGVAAIAATLLVSYLGTQAQAVGAGRMYTGIVARADRLVLLMVAPVADHALLMQGVTIDLGDPFPSHILGFALWYIALGGAVTAVERFARIYLFLRRAEKKA